ncbi:hypothetical protein SAMN05421730_102818 [Anaerobium acetethylicum]|uniref:Uncharacterized protein n=1 Tax=Anaerobium acetethylicum TaxID=1619234 RepID=A0A1D3TX63_9FIRM|nr:hypothetical protein SAMN05421730_102818 [Anaerobium acetethylicum]
MNTLNLVLTSWYLYAVITDFLALFLRNLANFAVRRKDRLLPIRDADYGRFAVVYSEISGFQGCGLLCESSAEPVGKQPFAASVYVLHGNGLPQAESAVLLE